MKNLIIGILIGLVITPVGVAYASGGMRITGVLETDSGYRIEKVYDEYSKTDCYVVVQTNGYYQKAVSCVR